MRIRIIALSLVCAASLCGQRRFRWQDYCFNNPGSIVCPGHEYAVKKPDAASRNVATNPYPSTPANVTPTVIVVGGIDWRFADPFADALVGFNFSAMAASPLARGLIAQLGGSQRLTDADMQKIFDGLSGVDQVAVSVRDNRVVAMVSGRVTKSTLLAPEAGLKAVPVSGNAVLAGHANAVDQAVQRIALKGSPADLTLLAEERQSSGELWAVGSADLVGPEAVSAGVKRFSLTVSIRDRVTSDVAFVFNDAPSADSLRQWQTALGAATVGGNVVHFRMSMEADEARQKFTQIAASPIGQRLAAVIGAARYLPVHDTAIPRQNIPVINGLDGGPKELN
jgi:hypothetical protein